MLDQVPIIDLSKDQSTCSAQVHDALKRYGFFYVKNHRVAPELVESQFQLSNELFDLSDEEKNAMPFDHMLDIGYVGSGVQTLNPDGTVQHVGDTKEQFMMTNNCLLAEYGTESEAKIDPNDIFAGSKNYEPQISNHTSVTKEYGSALYKLNLRLNDLLFDALSLPKKDRIRLGTQPFCVLKQMKYKGEISDASVGKFGAGAHKDWGAFTILATDQTPGLEIFLDDKWVQVPPIPGTFIINAGDQIERLTNNYFKSALHRVLTTSTEPRYSTAFFTYFSVPAVVDPLQQFGDSKHVKGQTTKEYFHFKLHESMGKSS